LRYFRQARYLHELLSFGPWHLKGPWVLLASLALLLLHGKVVYRYERVECVDRVGPNLHSFGGWCVQGIPARRGVSALVEIEDASLLLDLWSVVCISSFGTPHCALIIL
jgi:hypothetical protein